MEKRKKDKEIKVSLIIKIICSILLSAVVVYLHGRDDMPQINEAAEYVLLHNSDISAGVDKLRIYAEELESRISRYIPQKETDGGDHNN